MKEQFENVELEIVRFNAEDIIRTSGAGTGVGGDDSDVDDDF